MGSFITSRYLLYGIRHEGLRSGRSLFLVGVEEFGRSPGIVVVVVVMGRGGAF